LLNIGKKANEIRENFRNNFKIFNPCQHRKVEVLAAEYIYFVTFTSCNCFFSTDNGHFQQADAADTFHPCSNTLYKYFVRHEFGCGDGSF
jgi:hypothetical protein